MSSLELAEFQRAAVETICERLTDAGGSRRFLLADEVGLGKTVVARGVIDELLRRRRGRELVVVYLCSNTEIADQNRTKLAPNAPPSLRRITQLAWSTKVSDNLQLYSFTPGTSLSEGTGLAWERQLLLFLVHRVLRQDIRKGKWREYFRCGAGEERWKAATKFAVLRLEFNRKLRPGLQQRIAEEWRKPIEVDGATLVLSEVLRGEVDQFKPTDAGSRRRRNLIVGMLRSAAQRVLLDDLQPHLVILDEVQRFREVIEEATSRRSIAARLFERRPGVLILSATPYRMLALDHEGQGHYDEFLDTVRFLFADQGKQEVARLRSDLKAFRERLELGAFLRGHDHELLALRARIEQRLRKVICRTERNAYLHDPTKGVQEVRPTGNAFAVPQKEEVVDYIRLRRFLLDKVDTSQHITEYWKSCPAPFTFMDAQYAPMAAAKRKKAVVPAGVIEQASKLGALPRRNLRFRELFQAMFGGPDERWRFLWTRPTYNYYRDDFFRDADPKKMLVFSGWRFVPKAIALLTSHEAEQRIAPRGRLWEGDDRPPLRFTEKGSFHIFDVCLPSPALARLVEPSALASDALTAKELLRRTRKSLEDRLSMEAGVQVAVTSRSPIWQVVARLDRHSGSPIRKALEGSAAYNGDDITERFAEHVDTFVDWMEEEGSLRISEERLTHLARIAAFSPAISILRAFWTTYPDSCGEVHERLVDLCFGELRSYFNRRTVRAIVERSVPAGRGYARAAIEYCERAHFQAVADEYLYLVKNVLQRNGPAEMAEHLARVLGVGTGSPNINLTTDTGRIRAEQLVRRRTSRLPLARMSRPTKEPPWSNRGRAGRRRCARRSTRRSGRLCCRPRRSDKRGWTSTSSAATSSIGTCRRIPSTSSRGRAASTGATGWRFVGRSQGNGRSSDSPMRAREAAPASGSTFSRWWGRRPIFNATSTGSTLTGSSSREAARSRGSADTCSSTPTARMRAATKSSRSDSLCTAWCSASRASKIFSSEFSATFATKPVGR